MRTPKSFLLQEVQSPQRPRRAHRCESQNQAFLVEYKGENLDSHLKKGTFSDKGSRKKESGYD